MTTKRTTITAVQLGESNSLFPQSYSSVKRGEKARYVEFHKELNKASVEEDVKAAYRKFFSLPQDSSKHQDLYTTQMLFEFKYDKKFEQRHVKAEVLAQILYYVRRLKFNTNDMPVPPFLCLADVNETIITETKKWENFYNSDKYDWDAAPSSPDVTLIQDLEMSQSILDLRVFHTFEINELIVLDDTFKRIYNNHIDKSLIVKRDITERNFEDIYRSWYDKFAEDVRNGFKPSQYFICDIQEGKSFIRENIGSVSFDIEEGNSRIKKLDLRAYKDFWDIYNKNKSNRLDILRGILSKADRLSEDFQRRFEGEYYTPIHLAQKAIDYLDSVVFLQKLSEKVYVDKSIKDYIARIIAATRKPKDFIKAELADYINLGSSTRGAISFMQCAKALALIKGRGHVIPEDISDLRYSILRHRISLNFSAVADGVTVEQIIDALFGAVATP